MENKKENKENKEKRHKNKYALSAQAESRGDKVGVCWYDQCEDMSS